ncbi:MAG: fibronectin type III domain-containing protein [Proteobacteria bacterium]|nr:fibronectin type III domain-containing protein [Pseudomonadota bacterium]
MGRLKSFCGLAVAVLVLSGCGGGSGASSPSSSVSSSPPATASAPPATASSTTSSSPAPQSTAPTTPTTPAPTPPPPTPPPPSTPAPTNNTATLTWTAPTTNTNGSALTNLAGYEIHYGTTAGALSNTINIANPGATTYVVTNLTTGTWYFAMSAYTNTGLASPMSNIGSKTIG